MGDNSKVFFYEESQSDRLARKSKEAPFFPLGKLQIVKSFYLF